jgi:hypothetical protein
VARYFYPSHSEEWDGKKERRIKGKVDCYF